jgi:hypothetical protein
MGAEPGVAYGFDNAAARGGLKPRSPELPRRLQRFDERGIDVVAKPEEDGLDRDVGGDETSMVSLPPDTLGSAAPSWLPGGPADVMCGLLREDDACTRGGGVR